MEREKLAQLISEINKDICQYARFLFEKSMLDRELNAEEALNFIGNLCGHFPAIMITNTVQNLTTKKENKLSIRDQVLKQSVEVCLHLSKEYEVIITDN